MTATVEETTIGRRFLQARRRGPGAVQEMVALLADDAVCVEAVDDVQVIRGGQAIACYLREHAARDVDGLQVLKQVGTEDGRIAGYWRRASGAGGEIIEGRDVITVADGEVVRLHVEVLGRFA